MRLFCFDCLHNATFSIHSSSFPLGLLSSEAYPHSPFMGFMLTQSTSWVHLSPLRPIWSSSSIMQDNRLGARTHDIGVDRAQLVAPAVIPADAHLGSHVLLNTHVALIVTELADRDTLEPSAGTLKMRFSTEIFFGLGAGEVFGGKIHLEVGEVECDIASWQTVEHCFGVIFVRVGRVIDEVGVGELAIRVERVAVGSAFWDEDGSG